MSEVEGLKLPAWRYRWHDPLGQLRFLRLTYRRGMIRTDIKVPELPKTLWDMRFDRIKRKSWNRRSRRDRPYGQKRGPVLTKIHSRKICWGINTRGPYVPPAECMHEDILNSAAVKEYLRRSFTHGRIFYEALSCSDFRKNGVLDGFGEREAGGLIARMRNQHEWYLNFAFARHQGFDITEPLKIIESLGWLPADRTYDGK